MANRLSWYRVKWTWVGWRELSCRRTLNDETFSVLVFTKMFNKREIRRSEKISIEFHRKWIHIVTHSIPENWWNSGCLNNGKKKGKKTGYNVKNGKSINIYLFFSFLSSIFRLMIFSTISILWMLLLIPIVSIERYSSTPGDHEV